MPAAFSLYWVIGNIISIIQNIFIYKPLKKKEKEPVKWEGKKNEQITQTAPTKEEAITIALEKLGVTHARSVDYSSGRR